MNTARNMPLPSDSILVFDMGYNDFSWWNKLDRMNSWFVTRSKDNQDYPIIEDFDVSGEKDSNVLEDSNIRLSGIKSKVDYPKFLRRVRYWDEVNKNDQMFIINNRYWTATTVANIYKEHWYIGFFFELIKQNLKIKSFMGASENAVQIQIWTALITIMLRTLFKTKAKYQWYMSNLVNFIWLILFVKIDLWERVNQPFVRTKEKNVI